MTTHRTPDEKLLLREAWRQLQWFALQQRRAEEVKQAGGNEISCTLHVAYILKCAKVYHQIDAIIDVGSEAIEL